MEHFRFFLTSLLVLASLGFGQEEVQQSRIQQSNASAGVKKDSVKAGRSYNPAIALTSSMLIPGAGQTYTGHYIKAGLFFAAEVGIGLFGYQRYLYMSALKHNADSIRAIYTTYRKWSRKAGDSTAIDTGFYWQLKADSADMEKKELQNVVYQSVAWMVGAYYFNVLDALQCANVLKSDTKKNPAIAGWLSAVPGLGLGQVYNGELSKAGMILMTQLNLAYLVLNYHLIMRDCEKYETSVNPNNADQYSLFKGPQYDRWEFRRTTAFRNRNMWGWYSLAFYFYGILDAVVDAHLHDAPVKMRLEPDLVPQNKEVGLKATVDF